MPFTDDDLKRLKDHLSVDKEFHENATWVDHAQMEALLARLEAAESGFTEYHGLEMSKGCECRCCKAWRKAAGK